MITVGVPGVTSTGIIHSKIYRNGLEMNQHGILGNCKNKEHER